MDTEKLNENEVCRDGLELLGLLFDILKNSTGEAIPKKGWKDLAYLLKQFIDHALTIFSLRNGLVLNFPRREQEELLIETPSAIVLTRVVMETYYVIQQVFLSTMYDDDKYEFEYSCWKLKGYILNKKEFIKKSLDQEKQRESERYMEELIKVIKMNRYFKEEGKEEQKRILQGRRKIKWGYISQVSGLDLESQNFFYGYLSGFVHIDGLSADLMRKQVKMEDNKYTIITLINYLNPIIAKLIVNLYMIFPFAQNTCHNNAIAVTLAFNKSNIGFPGPFDDLSNAPKL